MSGTARNQHRKHGEHSRFLLSLLPLLLLVLLRDGVGERSYLTALLVYLPPLPVALVAALGILPGLRCRPWPAVALHLALGAAFVLVTSGVALPRLRPHRGGAGLRVVSYNVYEGGHGVAPITPLLQKEHPDVICLQEAGPGPRDTRGGWRDLARELPSGWRLVQRGELVIASRLPLVEAAWAPLSRRTPAGRFHDRDLLRATVRVAGQPVRILTTHLSVPTAPWILGERDGGLRHWRFLRALREEQSTRLMAALASVSGAVVLAGDFNSSPGSQAYARLAEALKDAFAAAGSGWGYTFPARWPLLRLDYVFAGGCLQVAAARVLAMASADHRPVLVDLLLSPCASAAAIPVSQISEDRPNPGFRRSTAVDVEWRPIPEIEATHGKEPSS